MSRAAAGKPRGMIGLGGGGGGGQGAPRRRPAKAKKATYRSQISHEANAIKLRIRKATVADDDDDDGGGGGDRQRHHHHHHRQHQQHRPAAEAVVAPEADAAPPLPPPPPPPAAVAKEPKRRRRPDASPTPRDSSGEEYAPTAPKQKPPRPHNHAKASKSAPAPPQDDTPQGIWGSTIPEELLVAIFERIVGMEGTLPSLIRLGRVCKLWHSASVIPALWGGVELTRHTKDKQKTDHRLVWILENRLTMCHQLNLGNWKVSNLPWVIGCLVESCPGIRDLNLSGWKRLTIDQLQEITTGLQKLARLDLSCTSETGSSGSCLSVASLTQMAQTMGDRLTHLTLANNKLSGLPTILGAIATHCPSLELLDLSNLAAVSHPATVPLERLQKGCPKLRVLRITNSQVVLATATTQEQVESPGFPLLEELSVACPSTDYKLVDDEVLGRLLKTSKCLKLLDVRGCIRITDSGLIKVPAWDLQHLFLSGCCVTRQPSSCLELICEKWSHSLLEVDLAWSTATRPLDAAVQALAEKAENSVLRTLNLCGSSVSFDPVKTILLKCPRLESVNLSSCRALPRGMKRLYTGRELEDLKDSFDPVKQKLKEEAALLKKETLSKKKAQNSDSKKKGAGSSPKTAKEEDGATPKAVTDGSEIKSPKSVISESEKDEASVSVKSPTSPLSSPALTQATASVRSEQDDCSPQSVQKSPITPKQFSPQPCSSAISTPKSNHTQDYSPNVSGSNLYDSDSRQDNKSGNNWNAGQFSPLTKSDAPSSSHPSPDTGNINKQDAQKPSGSWNFGHYSPSVSRQEHSPYSSQHSPYPSHVSPDMGQPVAKSNQSSWNSNQYSPARRQEAACSSQPSPEASGGQASRSSGQNWNLERFGGGVTLPSPDTSQVTSSGGKSGQWNLDRYSPMTMTPSPEVKSGHWGLGHFSPSDAMPKSNWNLGHFSPMARQEASPVGRQQGSPGGAGKVAPVQNNWNAGRYSPASKADSSCRVGPGEAATNNMWDSNASKSVGDALERTGGGGCFGNVDQVTTTTYCSSSNQVMYNGPSSVE